MNILKDKSIKKKEEKVIKRKVFTEAMYLKNTSLLRCRRLAIALKVQKTNEV